MKSILSLFSVLLSPQPFFFLLWRLFNSLKLTLLSIFSFKIICIFYAYSYLCSTRTRQASQRCSNVRVVFFYRRMATKNSFTKMYSSPSDLVQLLQSRGLVIFDRKKAKQYLSHIGYYRLSTYSYPMLSFPIKQGVSFDFAIKLYTLQITYTLPLLYE